MKNDNVSDLHIDPMFKKLGKRYPQWLIDAIMHDAMVDNKPVEEVVEKALEPEVVEPEVIARLPNENSRSFRKRVRKEYAKLFKPRYTKLMREYNDMMAGGEFTQHEGYYGRYAGGNLGRWR